MAVKTKKPRPADAASEELLRQIHEKLTSWEALACDVKVPGDLAPAFMTGRPELLKLAKPRELSAADCAHLFDLLACLMETNQLLQRHAALVAQNVGQATSAVQGILGAVRRLELLANFTDPMDDEAGDDDE